MKIWHTILFLSFFAPQYLNAKTTCLNTLNRIEAPASVRVDRISTTWAEVSWSAVEEASQYEIRTFDRQTGDLLHVVVVPGATTAATVTWHDLASGANETKIWSIDAQGVVSASFNSVLYDKVILEIVTTGIAVNQNPSTPCVLTFPANSCSNFTWAPFIQTTFRIQGPGVEPSEAFTIEGYTMAGTFIRRIVLRHNLKPEYKYSLSTGNNAFVIKKGSVTIATLSGIYVNNTSPSGSITRSAGDDFTHSISKTGQTLVGFTTNDGNDFVLPDQQHAPKNSAVIYPNPFCNLLHIQAPASTTIRLYNLMGALRQSAKVTSDQNAHVLETADLSPGVYFLHLDDGQNIQTHKLIKN
jgi:Secretion system C-terminal sorting domain